MFIGININKIFLNRFVIVKFIVFYIVWIFLL